MIPTKSPEDILAEASRRQSDEKAKYVVDAKRDRMRDLISQTVGKKIHDIIQFEDNNGDDIVVWVFCQIKKTDLSYDEKVIIMISLSEPSIPQKLYMDIVTFKSGRYWTSAGQNLVIALQGGTYNY